MIPAVFVVDQYLPDALLPTYEYLRDIFLRALSAIGTLPLTTVPGTHEPSDFIIRELTRLQEVNQKQRSKLTKRRKLPCVMHRAI
jgi:hypothetical protein